MSATRLLPGFIVSLFIITNVSAQDCKVSSDLLTGTYTGDCKNGKAEGMGKAVGKDTYEGEFKNGYPHGQGKYTSANGDKYDGMFIKGQREGKGTMIYRLGERDSILTGFWKKNQYFGKYAEQYKVYDHTIHVTSISAKVVVTNPLKQIDFYIETESGTGAYSGTNVISKPDISNLQILTGTYQRKVVNDSNPKRLLYTLEDVTFPFRAILTMGNDAMEIEFLEEGRWTVNVRMAY